MEEPKKTRTDMRCRVDFTEEDREHIRQEEPTRLRAQLQQGASELRADSDLAIAVE